MPRPPILPTIDWKKIYADAQDYQSWLAGAEEAERRDRMVAGYDEQHLPGPVAAGLAGLEKTVHVIAIAEDWCGDVIRHVPVLQKMADASGGRVKVGYITRDADPDLFARFLTNGGEAIPKFIFLSQDFVETGSWGPMPNECRELIARGKALGDTGKARKLVSARYAADPGKTEVIADLYHRIDIAATAELIVPD